jgi:hypothetical protein
MIEEILPYIIIGISLMLLILLRVTNYGNKLHKINNTDLSSIDNEVYLKQLMGEDYYNEHYKIK